MWSALLQYTPYLSAACAQRLIELILCAVVNEKLAQISSLCRRWNIARSGHRSHPLLLVCQQCLLLYPHLLNSVLAELVKTLHELPCAARVGINVIGE